MNYKWNTKFITIKIIKEYLITWNTLWRMPFINKEIERYVIIRDEASDKGSYEGKERKEEG